MIIEWEGLDDAIDFFNGLQKPPVKTILSLEKELALVYASTQAATHVITASLKLSGKTSSDFDGNEWSGMVSYGGPSAGVNNPVAYAIYEQQRGGAHDFILPAQKHEGRFEKIINGMFG